MQQLSDVLHNDDMTDFAEGVEEKILQTGSLTNVVGHQDFDVTINFEPSTKKNNEAIKVILTIHVDEPHHMDDADIRNIEKFIVSYVKSKSIKSVLKLYNDTTNTKSKKLSDIPIISEMVVKND